MDFKFNIVASFLLITMCLVQSCSAGNLLCVDEQYKRSPQNVDRCRVFCTSEYQDQSVQPPMGECHLSKGLVYCRCTFDQYACFGCIWSKRKEYYACYGPTGEKVTDICSMFDKTSVVLENRSPATPILNTQTPGLLLCATEDYQYNLLKEDGCNAWCRNKGLQKNKVDPTGVCYVSKGYANCTCVGKETQSSIPYPFASYSVTGEDITGALQPLLSSRLLLVHLTDDDNQIYNYPILSPETQTTLQNAVAERRSSSVARGSGR